MAISSGMLRKELAEVSKWLELAVREKQGAERKVAMLEAKRRAYLILLGDPTVIYPEGDARDGDSSGTKSPSKRALIRLELQNAGPEGAKPVQIFNALKDKGVKRAYVHTTLSRMKDTGSVSVRNGRYRLEAVQ